MNWGSNTGDAFVRQSRTISFSEAMTNVVVGDVLAIATQIVTFPWFGIETALAEHLTIGPGLRQRLAGAHRIKQSARR